MSQYSSPPTEKDMKYEKDVEFNNDLTNVRSRAGSVHDDIFGEITDEGPNYRAVCICDVKMVEPQGLTSNRLVGSALLPS